MRKPLNNFYAVVITIVRVLCKIVFPYTVEGLEELPQERVLLCPNHASDLDPVLIAESQAWISEQYISDAPAWGVFDVARWNAFYQWLNENGLTECAIPTDYGFTNDYLE